MIWSIFVFLISAFLFLVTGKGNKRKHNYKNYLKQKGNQYEFYIADYFRKDGYKIYMKGYNEGFKDEGIDLICYKGKEMILVQCKNWNNAVELKTIKKFVYDCREYEQRNYNIVRKRRVRKLFIVSNEFYNEEIYEYIKQIKNEIEFLQIPFFD